MPSYREAKGVSQQACVVVSKKVVALMEYRTVAERRFRSCFR